MIRGLITVRELKLKTLFFYFFTVAVFSIDFICNMKVANITSFYIESITTKIINSNSSKKI